MLRSGYLSGATLKARLQLSNEEDDEAEEEYEEYIVDNGSDGAFNGLVMDGRKEVYSKYDVEGKNGEEAGKGKGEIDEWLGKNLDQGTKKYENIQKILECFSMHVPFDLAQKQYMEVLKKDSKTNYRVRVYIISCQNLSAMSSEIDLKSRLAGMTALCTANPYPVITVGDGNNDNEERLIKKYDGYERSIDDELSPQFLMMQELDMQLPQDWKLNIAIYDKSKVGRLGDKLIGATAIDLENRRHGDQLM